MPSRTVPLVEDIPYHIYNRGLNKQIIFHDAQDYRKFLECIDRYKKDFLSIEILSYCLLPNHFHLVLRSTASGEDISDFMNRIQQTYAIYRRLRHGTQGPMLGSRFKAKPLEDESYFEQVMRYVNLNPLKHGITDNISTYPWTSYHELSQKYPPSTEDLQLIELEN